MPYSPLISKIRVHNPNKKGTAVANRNYTTYIATREGVALEGVNNIDDLLKNENVLQSNLNENIIHKEASNEGYVRYMARRPRSHGLFGNIDTENLDEIARNVSKLSSEGKIIYRGIISLSEKDANELQFKNVDAWNNYLQRVMPDIAQELGVSVTDHTWIAAFHAEESHPHVHYELWDNKDKVRSPYIHVATQKRIRDMLSQEMFDDGYERAIREVYKEQLSELKVDRNQERSNIMDLTKNIFHDIGYVPGVEYEKLPDKITHEDLKKIANETNKLISMLPGTGRLTYKYLPPVAKEQLTKLTNMIVERVDMKREIGKYLLDVEKMHEYYGHTKTEISNAKKMAQADIEKRLKNTILKELKKSIVPDVGDEKNIFEDNGNIINDVGNEEIYVSGEPIEFLINDNIDSYYIDWNESYKEAMDLLSSNEVEKDKISEALLIMKSEADAGNAIAIEKVGMIFEKELVNVEGEEAENYYKESRKAYELIYNLDNNSEYLKNYAAYKMGKLYDMGKGGEQDFLEAEKWYEKAEDNKFAQYSLAKMYMDNKVDYSRNNDYEKNYKRAFELMEKSALKKNPFASYELGNMYCKGIGTKIDITLSNENYAKAYNLFSMIVKGDGKNDDNILYRLGKMAYEGMGTQKNIDAAIEFFKKSANLGNENAMFMLSKIYIEQGDDGQYKKAMETLEKLAQGGNSLAEYKLGAIYADPENRYYNMKKAMEYLERSAEQKNQFAEYKLGTIYADPENDYYNMKKAIEYLERSAEQKNQSAEYKLGFLYSKETSHMDLYKAIKYLSNFKDDKYALIQLGNIYMNQEYGHYNPEFAEKCFTKAALAGDVYAQYKLGTMYYFGNGIKQNKSMGEKWLREAALKEGQFAQYAKDILSQTPGNFGLSYLLVKASISSIASLNQNPNWNQNFAKNRKRSLQNKKDKVKARDFLQERL